ncbi:unnamed protein product [Arabidopsis thaliana]|uniref:(thale cress) hypothetical protein n=1 Tax=Arabidopsis thaliana TaxID=3702 RepID=A0A7G2F190_ARATH|nr:unnamed protein product [Arabidopsis thaliana]CAD5327288.1 unnamed protein product [Arabidopsis thaliana]
MRNRGRGNKGTIIFFFVNPSLLSLATLTSLFSCVISQYCSHHRRFTRLDHILSISDALSRTDHRTLSIQFKRSVSLVITPSPTFSQPSTPSSLSGSGSGGYGSDGSRSGGCGNGHEIGGRGNGRGDGRSGDSGDGHVGDHGDDCGIGGGYRGRGRILAAVMGRGRGNGRGNHRKISIDALLSQEVRTLMPLHHPDRPDGTLWFGIDNGPHVQL